MIAMCEMQDGGDRMAIPKDPVILLSFVNTQMRNRQETLDEFAKENNVDAAEIREKLQTIGYTYDFQMRQFRIKEKMQEYTRVNLKLNQTEL